jgi:hypothetical protein
MKTELLGNKIRGKIGFLGGEKETQGVRKEILLYDGHKKCCCMLDLFFIINQKVNMIRWKSTKIY